MKPVRILCVVGTMLLISQWPLTVLLSDAAEEERSNLQYEESIENERERILEEEAEPSDIILELDEQIARFEQERMLEEEAEPSDEALELDEQISESELEFMPDEEALPFDDNPPEEQDLSKEGNTPAE